MQIIDISPLITEETAVFPGDSPFNRKTILDKKHGNNITVSTISTTVHIGAHVDAPNHYLEHGEGISSRSLNYYIGECQIFRVNLNRGERITLSYFKGISEFKKSGIRAERILFRTDSFPNPNKWNADFNALSPELVDFLAEKKVILVGIDTPSIDLAEDKDLITHQVVAKHNMAILEGVTLSHVDDGVYNLIALPLNLKNCDASPVRAVLIKK